MENISFMLVSHGNFATGALETLEMLVGPTENWKAIGLFPGEGMDELKGKIDLEISRFNSENIMVFTDIQGGTPSNTCVQLIMEKSNVYVFSGFNLPLLLDVYTQNELTLNELAEYIREQWNGYLIDINEKVRGINHGN